MIVGHIQKVLTIIPVAARNLAGFRESLELARAVENLQVSLGEEPNPRRLEYDQRILPLVEAEKERGFSFLYGLGTIAIWSALEAFVDDLLLNFFAEDPSYISADPVQSIKVKLGTYEALSPEDRRRFVLDTIKRDFGRSPGVGKFEGMLGEFGLGGEVPRELRDTVLELREVRNIVVHKNGVVDSSFLERCPFFPTSKGKKVSVDEFMLSKYGMAAMGYGVLVFSRFRRRSGDNVEAAEIFVVEMVRILRSLEEGHREQPRRKGGDSEDI